MKVLICQHDEGDYDGWVVLNDACFLVPNDFSEEILGGLRKQWVEITWQTKLRGGKQTKRTYQTVPFLVWLSERFESVEFLEDLQ
jgi:hypothetical protein